VRNTAFKNTAIGNQLPLVSPPGGSCPAYALGCQAYLERWFAGDTGNTLERMKKKDLNQRLPQDQVANESGQERPLEHCLPAVEWLYKQSDAQRWGLPRERFHAALERSASKRLAGGGLSQDKLEEFLHSLHYEDLALACACADGIPEAWQHFVAIYRGYLRTAAAAVLRRSSSSPEACDLADSLFAELYGLADGKGGERSLFRYFHGRSTLKTWLRAVLAQRHIDEIRAGRRFEELGDDDAAGAKQMAIQGPTPIAPDPHRDRYLAAFRDALNIVLKSLPQLDSDRLRMYYAEEITLAEIGRKLGEHESSVSRNLERIRKEMRKAVEDLLRHGMSSTNGTTAGQGFSDAEIALCFEYAAADAPIDFDKIFAKPSATKTTTDRRES
jgi:RNA polymerase sigma factor (sigma-70 family)